MSEEPAPEPSVATKSKAAVADEVLESESKADAADEIAPEPATESKPEDGEKALEKAEEATELPALADSELVRAKRSTSYTPWSVYAVSFAKSREVLNLEEDHVVIEKDLPRLTPKGCQVKQLGQLAAAIHAGQEWEVLL